MALSRCPRESCSGTLFEMKELRVQHSNFRYNAIQCSTCGAVVSTTELAYLSDLLHRLAKALNVRL